MLRTINYQALLATFVLLIYSVGVVSAQTTEFMYQGKITDAGGTAASYDFEFRLFEVDTGGTAIGINRRDGVPVSGGVFSVRLDFGGSSTFRGTERWIEVAVKLAGSPNPYTVLSPRQPVASAPYSIRSLNTGTADLSLNSNQLGGVAANQFVQTTDTRLTDARNPLPNSGNYVQNATAPQAASNFNISGVGAANIFNAATQYNIGGSRVLASSGFFGNLFVGNNAGAANGAGGENSFFGQGAGQANTTGGANSFFGRNAGSSNTGGASNSFFGEQSGFGTSTGNNNSYFGQASGRNSTTASDNAFFGYRAGANNTASGNSFFGSGAGDSVTTGANNAFFGRSAGAAVNLSSGSSFFGFQAGLVNTADANSFFGAFAGDSNSTGGGNSFFGYKAGESNAAGASNAFFGSEAGVSALASNNAFFGYRSGATADTENNAFFGYRAGGDNNTSTPGNSFFGAKAGALGFADQDSFFGFEAGLHSRHGKNSFFGYRSGADTGNFFGTTEAEYNSFFGHTSGPSNETGSWNTYIGALAGIAITGGIKNVFVGGSTGLAGNGPADASYNTLLGFSANISSTNSLFRTAIGADSLVSTDDTIVLGKLAGTHGGVSRPADRVIVPGSMVIDGSLVVSTLGSPNTSAQLCRNTADRISPCSSSLRYKTNVTMFPGGLDVVRRLRPITFNWKEGGMHDVGFAAEEVEKIEPLLTTYNDKGEIEGVKYGQVTAVLVNAVNEQQQVIEQQQRQIDALKKLVCLAHPQADVCR